jgi:hypothetical protein
MMVTWADVLEGRADLYWLAVEHEWLGAQPGFDQRNAPNPEDYMPECRPMGAMS